MTLQQSFMPEIEVRQRGRGRRARTFIVEFRLRSLWDRSWGTWRKWKAYRTAKERDAALGALIRKSGGIIEYRSGG